MSRWRERLDEFDDEHRHMLEGGSISQLFLGQSLSFSHPFFVGIVYAMMLNLTLLLPILYEGNSNSENISGTIKKWINESLIILLLCAVLGSISALSSSLFKKPPLRLEKRRRYLFPLPFIGFLLSTITIIFSTPEVWKIVGYSILIIPGPLYIQISYAPRWRMIERIDRDLDPFDGMDVTIYEDDDKDNLSEQNLDELEKAVDELD